MVIYKTTNLINGKFYIGKQTTFSESYMGSGKLLKNAILKYGIENFEKEVLEEVDSLEQLNEREIYWIDKLNAKSEGYNIADGGDGGDTISNHPDKINIIKKIAFHSKGKNNGMYNKKHTFQSKEKMSINNYGHRIKGKSWDLLYGEDKAREFKEKTSKALKGRSYEELHGKEKSKELKENLSTRLKGKTYEELYGKEKAIEIKTKQSNHIVSNETRKKMSAKAKGKTWEERYGKETAQRMKLERKLKSKKY